MHYKDFSKAKITFNFGPRAPKNPKKSNVIMYMEGKSEWVMRYRVNQVQRGEGYKTFKKEIEDFLLNKLKILFPKIHERVEFVECATPLSFENYLGRIGMYGMEMNKSRL